MYTEQDYTHLKERLMSLADEKYKEFHSGLIPGAGQIIGVRAPELRRLAKELSKDDFRGYLSVARCDTHEEKQLQGLVIGGAKMEIEERIGYIQLFVPKIDNWAICDTFVSSLKSTTRHAGRVREAIEPYLRSDAEYTLRFGLVMLLSYYVTPESIDDTLEQLRRVRHEAYYVKMAAAWALAECFTKQRDKTLPLIQSNDLEIWIHNKGIQKICESFRVSDEDKAMLRAMKRGGK